jgi:hypothetical protein
MAPLLAILAGLVGALIARRMGRAGDAPDAVVWGKIRGSNLAWGIAVLGALLAQAPIIAGARVFLAPHALLIGDAQSHATIAQAIARNGLPHGWVDTYNGGFPFGVHYQSMGYLLIAGLIRAGISAVPATQCVGIGATLALPVAVVLAARAAGTRPEAGLFAATIVAWAAPGNQFIGGWETYLVDGLIAQALALPLAVALGVTVACDTPRYRAPVLASLLAATHPQIATCFFAALAPAFLASAGRWRGRYVRAAVAASIAGVAIYARGVGSLHVPYGFPPAMPAWKQLGFPMDHIPDWLFEGDLFDSERVPVISFFWIASWVVLLTKVRERVPRALLASSAVSLLLSASGHGLSALGRFGKLLLGFIMPLRITGLLLVLIAACAVVALEELLRVSRHRAITAGATAVCLLAMGALAAPPRWRWARSHLELLESMRYDGGTECGRLTPKGYRSADAFEWVRELDRGRFTFENKGLVGYCNGIHGVDLVSPVALGMCNGAATHVGINVAAFAAARPGADGAWNRFETLGIRSVLHLQEESPPSGEPWLQTHRSAALGMSIRLGGNDLVGAACVDELWRGDDDALRKALGDDLLGAASLLTHPRSLVALERAEGPLTRAPARRPACDASNAVVREHRREPGALEADVTSPTSFDAVFRATAFSSWQTTVDGRRVPWRLVAPGFFAVEVPAGAHHLEAIADWPPGYLVGLVMATALVALLGVERSIAWFTRIFINARARLRPALPRAGER